ncbi:Membrane protein TerC, possibly involved in tellurium resistance [Kordiimonas lacus]|uniref:Membrane protein TerC, possibly involved in tellurium resistance n=2 Tax=Kordiimonadaceae TaxID=1331809 RepID=A0A1G6XYV9_9PROT|nr:Membrane protein TerC, possibly involved in tellurium resistance [Kordiimonas lacus]
MDYHVWVSFLTLTTLEIILGIDNVVFIALLVGHLPEGQRKRARMIGLTLALVMRILLLLGVAWIISLQTPWLTVFGQAFSGKDMLMLLGGGFLLYKGTNSIHDEVTGDYKEEIKAVTGGMAAVILQVVFIDIIFSFDSVMTAVGMTKVIPVIVAAMTVAMLVMMFSSGYIASIIERFPTLKILALSFIMLIGVFLVAEGLGFHVPKGYIYFAMAFSLGVETLNLLRRRRKAARQQG